MKDSRNAIWNLFSKPIFFTLFCYFLSGCATVYNPATGKKELILINSAQEVQIGRGMAGNVIAKEQRLLNDPAKQLLINKIGQRVVRVSDRTDIIYNFKVLDSPDFNAFALPGGYVYITSGLMDKLDEDAIAAVLAHEVGHVAAKHSVKRMQAALGYDLLVAIALVGIGNNDPKFAQDIASMSDTIYGLLSLGYSREDELFADKLSVRYLDRAGYNPYAMVKSLELLDKEEGPGGRVFEILSTHPRMQERIAKAKAEVEALQKIKLHNKICYNIFENKG